MSNPVPQARIVSVRQNAAGDGHLLRLRLRLEAGDQPGDLEPGWYAATLPIQNIRLRQATDEAMSEDEIVADDTRPLADRLAALGTLHPPLPPPG